MLQLGRYIAATSGQSRAGARWPSASPHTSTSPKQKGSPGLSSPWSDGSPPAESLVGPFSPLGLVAAAFLRRSQEGERGRGGGGKGGMWECKFV